MKRQIQLTAANLRECKKIGNNLKSVIPKGDGTPLEVLEEPNQEIQLNFLGRYRRFGGLISAFSSVDRFSKFPSLQVTLEGIIKNFLENYFALHAILCVIRTDQG